MSDNIAISSLRKRILKHKGIEAVEPKTKRLLQLEDLPDYFPKSSLMRYIEAKYYIRLEREIFTGSLTDVCQKLGWEVDRSTISRWRKHILQYVTFL